MTTRPTEGCPPSDSLSAPDLEPAARDAGEPAPLGADEFDEGEFDEGLVAPNEERMRRRAPRALTLFFFAVLVGSTLVDRVWPFPPIRVFGAERPAESGEPKLVDGSLARAAERWLVDRSRAKRVLQSLYAAVLYRGVGETRGLLVRGRDGWVFLDDRFGTQPVSTQRAVDLTSFLMASVARRVRTGGIRFVCLPIPRKVVMDAEYLPPGIRSRPDLDRRVIDGLLESGVETVDLLRLFEESLDDEPFYARRDSHWTYDSRLRVARHLADVLAPGAEPSTRTRLVGPLEGDENLDLLRYLGMQPEIASALLEVRKTSFHVVLPRGDSQASAAGAADDGRRVFWLVGTSFSADEQFPAFIEHFSDTEVLNYSRGGEEPVALLSRAYRALPETIHPRTVVLEFPLHMALEEPILRHGLLALGGLRIRDRAFDLEQPETLVRAEGWNEPIPLGGTFVTIATILKHRLARFADAGVTVRLRRAAGGDVLLIGTKSAFGVFWTRWPAGEQVLDLAIPGARGASDRVDVLASMLPGRPSVLELRTCRLLLDVDPERFVEGAPGEVQRHELPVFGEFEKARGWMQRVEFAAPVGGREGGELLLEIRTGVEELRGFEVLALDSSGHLSRPVPIQGVHRFGQVVLPAAALGTEPFRTLILRGNGPLLRALNPPGHALHLPGLPLLLPAAVPGALLPEPEQAQDGAARGRVLRLLRLVAPGLRAVDVGVDDRRLHRGQEDRRGARAR